MRFNNINPLVLEGTTFSFQLAFLNKYNQVLIGVYSWKQGRNTDWVICGREEYPLSSFIGVALVEPPNIPLDLQLKFVVENHILQHGGYASLNLTYTNREGYDTTFSF